MSGLALLGGGGLVTVLLTLLVLGAVPVFAVRCIACLYPKDDPRRAELVAEMAHVRGLGRAVATWYWLGQVLALGVCDGPPTRWRERRRRRLIAALSIRMDAQVVEVRLVRKGGELRGSHTVTVGDLTRTPNRDAYWFDGLRKSDRVELIGPWDKPVEIDVADALARHEALERSQVEIPSPDGRPG